MKLYNKLIIKEDCVELDGELLDAVMGKHCIWIPSIEAKIILSFQGHIESTEWELGRRVKEIKDLNLNADSPGFTIESLYSIANEFRLLQLLAEQKMSPNPKEIFYIKTTISNIFTSNWHRFEKTWIINKPGDLYTDKKGMFGYFIRDANKLEPGKYTFEKFKELFLDSGRIKANPGALGDLAKKEGNLVNGYLVDVRRTMEYMMQVNEELNIDKLIEVTYESRRTKG